MNPLIDALGEDYFLGKPLDNFTDGDTILGIHLRKGPVRIILMRW